MVSASLRYLIRDDRYDSEKPYEVEFEIEERDGVQKSNLVLADMPVTISPIESLDDFQLDVHGFCILQEAQELDPDAALRCSEDVQDLHFDSLAAILRRKFPEYKRIEPFEFTVRHRHANFPSDVVASVPHEQPACLPHSDYSVRGAVLQLNNSFPGQEEHLKGREYDMINVWRVLVGPNDDWPLAVCDYTSINATNDPRPTDRVLIDRVAENQLLQYNPNHQWYYIPQQQPDHLLVFRNVDSSGKRAMAFHASFYNPSSTSSPRKSCEARFVAFR